MTRTGTAGVELTGKLKQRIDDQRHSTVSRSEWLRGAARMKLAIMLAADDRCVDPPEEWWLDAIEQYLDELASVEQNATDVEI